MIQNDFTIKVYETHARIAIKNVTFVIVVCNIRRTSIL
jgi:hypothetical protein